MLKPCISFLFISYLILSIWTERSARLPGTIQVNKSVRLPMQRISD
nr:MAG TPA: hypothetical protein [Caudoviricetes sp.]